MRKRAFSTLCGWTPGAEEEIASAAAAALGALEAGAEWKEAAAALAQAVRDGKAWPHAHAAAAALATAPERDDWNARPGRDLPARQRLLGLVGHVLGWPAPARRACAGELQALASALAGDGSLFGLRARLLLGAEDFSAPLSVAPALRRLAQGAGADSPWSPELAGAVGEALASVPWEPDAALALADAVVDVAPLVALELVGAAGRRTGWLEPAAGRLRALRRHPSAFVQSRARALATSAE